MVGNPYLTRIMEGLPVIQEEQFTDRSEEHTSELRHGYISYAVFCLKKKSTRLNSSHGYISYAVFCLKNNTSKLPIEHYCLNASTDPNIVRASDLPAIIFHAHISPTSC